MKNILMMSLVISLFFCYVNPANADTAMDKLMRGGANIILSPIEVLNGMLEAKEDAKNTPSVLQSGGWDSALTWGIVNGVLKTGLRLLVGAYEVVTFLIPIPKDYKGILPDINQTEIFGGGSAK